MSLFDTVVEKEVHHVCLSLARFLQLRELYHVMTLFWTPTAYPGFLGCVPRKTRLDELSAGKIIFSLCVGVFQCLKRELCVYSAVVVVVLFVCCMGTNLWGWMNAFLLKFFAFGWWNRFRSIYPPFLKRIFPIVHNPVGSPSITIGAVITNLEGRKEIEQITSSANTISVFLIVVFNRPFLRSLEKYIVQTQLEEIHSSFFCFLYHREDSL